MAKNKTYAQGGTTIGGDELLQNTEQALALNGLSNLAKQKIDYVNGNLESPDALEKKAENLAGTSEKFTKTSQKLTKGIFRRNIRTISAYTGVILLTGAALAVAILAHSYALIPFILFTPLVLLAAYHYNCIGMLKKHPGEPLPKPVAGLQGLLFGVALTLPLLFGAASLFSALSIGALIIGLDILAYEYMVVGRKGGTISPDLYQGPFHKDLSSSRKYRPLNCALLTIAAVGIIGGTVGLALVGESSIIAFPAITALANIGVANASPIIMGIAASPVMVGTIVATALIVALSAAVAAYLCTRATEANQEAQAGI